jgi:hypothetical protein
MFICGFWQNEPKSAPGLRRLLFRRLVRRGIEMEGSSGNFIL